MAPFKSHSPSLSPPPNPVSPLQASGQELLRPPPKTVHSCKTVPGAPLPVPRPRLQARKEFTLEPARRFAHFLHFITSVGPG